MAFRIEKVNSLLMQLASAFLQKEASGALVTITRIETSKDLKLSKIFISIFPESKEKEIFGKIKAKAGEFRDYSSSKIKMKFLPYFEFEIDQGEKARAKIDELLKH